MSEFLKSFWERLFPTAGGVYASLNSLNLFITPASIPQHFNSIIIDIDGPEMCRVVFFGFLGGVTGWLAKQFCEYIYKKVEQMFNKVKKLF